MPFIPSLAAYSYDGTWFLAKALDNVVKNHGVKLENITTGNETFYDLLLTSLSTVTFTGLTVRTYIQWILTHWAGFFLHCTNSFFYHSLLIVTILRY